MFEASYDASTWRGQVAAYKLAAGTGMREADSPWGHALAVPGADPSQGMTTAVWMDAQSPSWPAQRLVLTSRGHAGGSALEESAEGTVFEADERSLSADQWAALNALDGLPDGYAVQRVAFLRGARDNEADSARSTPGADGRDGPVFRQRASRHGDIVNSQLWYQGGKPDAGYLSSGYLAFRKVNAARAAMLYVGANDGMLHGFDASTGEEKIAYVPQGVYPRLAQLTRPGYRHVYTVDGSPFSADLNLGQGGKDDWRTFLAGFLGAGGKGYFVLDMTDPAAFGEDNAARIVRLDTTASGDLDIGAIFSQPARERAHPMNTRQITRMNDGRWALITGNGYNSAREQAVLLIQSLDDAGGLRKIPVGPAGGNGLSAPRTVDVNGDGTPDIVYAGDLQGQLWKFDLSSPNPAQWKAVYGDTPLYRARAESGAIQPITTAPVWVPHPNGGVMVVFATGRNLSDDDPADTAIQTVYGVYDSAAIEQSIPAVISGGTAVADGRRELAAQTIPSGAMGVTAAGHAAWTHSASPVNYTGTQARRGWYLDLTFSPGARVTDNLGWYQGTLVEVPITVPARGEPTQGGAAACTGPPAVAGQRYSLLINAVNGQPPHNAVVELAGDSTSVPASIVEGGGPAGSQIRVDGGMRAVTGTNANASSTELRRDLPRVGRYPSWHQLQ
jgi:type IV pilus assembly protein PilY1